eukprot:TRINITY_DN3829_c0_g1_i4.p1 TRINITY_DN3829_c0_g1~~TRINITY_DN3829_c0_g1_i4.p1  ORF type:complete len:508 (-),score=78.70 TRINITY_DN3829_c0_g1_i4:322-1845(-)
MSTGCTTSAVEVGLDEPPPLPGAKQDALVGSKFMLLLRQLQEEYEADVSALRRECEQWRQGSTEATTREIVEESNQQSKEETTRVTRRTEGSLTSRPDSGGLRHITRSFDSGSGASRPSFLHRLVYNHWFDAVSGVIVFLNSMVIAFETQYNGHDVGHSLKYSGHKDQAEEYYPHGMATLEFLSWIFGCVYIIELLLRVCASPRRCAKEMWNWFDFVVVVFWVISRFENALPINSSFLRLARLVRLLRLLRLARALQGMDALFIITTAMQGCASVLFWTFTMLGLFQLLLSLFIAQYLQAFYFDSASHDTDQVLVFQYFGTFMRAFFSVCEVTLGNWPPACRVLAENVGEVFFVLGMLHKLVIGFAVVAIINGVFIQETFKVTAMDDILMVRRKQQALECHTKKMKALWTEADSGGDGEITIDEWQQLLKDPGVKTWLASMELDARDARLVFELLDESNDGTVSFDELVVGVSKLKGAARSIDLHALAREHQRLHDIVCKPLRLRVQ